MGCHPRAGEPADACDGEPARSTGIRASRNAARQRAGERDHAPVRARGVRRPHGGGLRLSISQYRDARGHGLALPIREARGPVVSRAYDELRASYPAELQRIVEVATTISLVQARKLGI